MESPEYQYALRGELSELMRHIQGSASWSLSDALEGFWGSGERTAEVKQAVAACCRAAAGRGHQWVGEDLYRVAWYGDAATIKWLIAEQACPWDHYALGCAARHPDGMAALELIHDASPLTATQDSERDMEIMMELNIVVDPRDPCLMAIQGDNPAGLSFLRSRAPPYPLPKEPMGDAVLENSCEVVRWLRGRQPPVPWGDIQRIKKISMNRAGEGDPSLAKCLEDLSFPG